MEPPTHGLPLMVTQRDSKKTEKELFFLCSFGRRVPHCIFMLISGLSCLLVLTVPNGKCMRSSGILRVSE